MNENGILQRYLAEHRLRRSRQREAILGVFLGIESHLSADELWAAVRAKHPSVGQATVYRTLRLFCRSGLCREVRLADGTTRYEHGWDHGHHDHIVCTSCGRCVEVVDEEIERLQRRLMDRHGFTLESHQMSLYGRCGECRGKG